jgi:hypothetical protein
MPEQAVAVPAGSELAIDPEMTSGAQRQQPADPRRPVPAQETLVSRFLATFAASGGWTSPPPL